jgi:hypothetical protein
MTATTAMVPVIPRSSCAFAWPVIDAWQPWRGSPPAADPARRTANAWRTRRGGNDVRRHAPKTGTDLQVAEPPALEVPVSSRPTIVTHMSEQVRRVGRPRQWASEAERKRAYRARRAAELADPLELRRTAQDARRETATQQSAAETARQEADRWRERAATAHKRAVAAERRAVRAEAAAHRLVAERDEARRLLRRKLQWAKHAEHARLDPGELLALVAELYAELAKLRTEVSTLRRKVQRPDA